MAANARVVNVLVVDDMKGWHQRVSDLVREDLCEEDVQSTFTHATSFPEAAHLLSQPDVWDLLVTDVSLGSDQFQEDRKGIDLVGAAIEIGVPSIAMSASITVEEIEKLYTRFGHSKFFYVDKTEFRSGLHSAIRGAFQAIISRFIGRRYTRRESSVQG
jgi:CheY-like chemotaxis protein